VVVLDQVVVARVEDMRRAERAAAIERTLAFLTAGLT